MKELLKKLKKLKKKNPYSDNIKEINSILNLTYLNFLIKYYKEQFEKDFLNRKKYYEILKNFGFIKIMKTKGNKKNRNNLIN